jgi:hypothetical protein
VIDLRAMLESGELARIARASANRTEYIRSLGISLDAYDKRVRRLKCNGVNFPTYAELRGEAAANENVSLNLPNRQDEASDFDSEEPTEPQNIGKPDKFGTYRNLDENIEPSIPLDPTPRGHFIRGVSTLVGEDGAIKQQWVKTQVSAQQAYEALVESLPLLLEPYRGKSEPVAPPTSCDADLMNIIPIGDAHLGLLVWGEECGGENYDLDIAEKDLRDVVDRLVSVAPNARRALLIDLGDFTHADSNRGETTKGTRVDVDTRWRKVMRTALRTKRCLIDRLKEKHELVEAWTVPGNHNEHSAAALSLALESYYENDPRVTINPTPSKFFWCRFGKNLIGSTHGDTVKMDKLGAVMACDRPQDWGETFYRYWYTGHLHHDVTKELPGVIVETFRTLAAGDAWHHAQGYRSGRDLKVDTIHREYGRICRSIVSLRQSRAARSAS